MSSIQAEDHEFSALLDELWRTNQNDIDAMQEITKKLLADRLRKGKEQGAYYWQRQVNYWNTRAAEGSGYQKEYHS